MRCSAELDLEARPVIRIRQIDAFQVNWPVFSLRNATRSVGLLSRIIHGPAWIGASAQILKASPSRLTWASKVGPRFFNLDVSR